MEIILRKEAKELGLKRYFTGKLCKRSHISERRVSDRHCIECAVSGRKKAYNKEYHKIYQKTDKRKQSKKRSELKYPNAKKARAHYGNNKHKIKTYDNCEKCGSVNRVEAHHHDYNLPLDVTFLCKACHTTWHENNTPLNKVNGIFTE